MNVLKIWCIALLILLTFEIENLGYAEDVTKIGAILPLSGDGAFWGDNPQKGINLAIEDLKSQKSIDNMRFMFEDDRCDPKTAVSAFHKLVDLQKVKIIVGPACSSAAAAVAPLAERAKVFLLPFAESDEVKTGQYVRRLWVPNSLQGKLLAQYAYDQGYRSVATLSIQNAFGTTFSFAFNDKFNSLGGKVIINENYQPSMTTLKAELTRIKGSKPDALVFGSYINDGAILVREARQLGFTNPLLGPSTINSSDFFKSTAGVVDGLVFADLEDFTPDEFRNRWRSTYKVDYPGLQSGASIFYDITMMLGEWLKDHQVSDLGEYLSATTYPGTSGQIKFTSEGSLDRQHVLYTIKNGQVKLLK